MRIEFDTEKRDKTLLERGLDFACAGEVFAGVTVTFEDARQNYGEVRFITVGTRKSGMSLDRLARITVKSVLSPLVRLMAAWLFWSGHPAARRAASSA